MLDVKGSGLEHLVAKKLEASITAMGRREEIDDSAKDEYPNIKTRLNGGANFMEIT